MRIATSNSLPKFCNVHDLYFSSLTRKAKGLRISKICANRSEGQPPQSWVADSVNMPMIKPPNSKAAKDARHTMAVFRCTITILLELVEDQADHGLEVVEASWAKTFVEVEMNDMIEERVAAE